ncbi:MAG: glycoside hydrolase family 9 protein [Abitibacteriaceae bacterium]|nr:glycoside hydrolase family 9 protein [Abditibacteriaceae bacterium]
MHRIYLFFALAWYLTPTQFSSAQGIPPKTIVTFDAPFLFSYGSWQNKVRVENGRALLRGEGVNPRGGAGSPVTLDLSADANSSPALRVKVGAANTMPHLRLLLGDAAGRTGTWEFTLPAPSDTFAVVTPQGGAPLSKPNALDKPNQFPDSTKIRQWQLIGDWSSDKPLDVEVSGILLIAPDAAMQAQRTQVAQQEAAERERLRQEQEARHKQYQRNANSPEVEAISLVAPDILSLTIQAGHVVPGSLTKYVLQPGDEKRAKDRQVILVRGGQEIGWLIGPQRDNLVAYEKLEGDPLLEDLADMPTTYTIRSQDDAAFNTGVQPVAVFRKSKPTDWAQPGKGLAMRHIVYLKLPRPLIEGKTYSISVGELNLKTPTLTFTCAPSKTRSEAVHVNQIGYRPDDPAKRAFLSLWLGTGGAYQYPPNLRFSLLEDASGKAVYNDKVELAQDVNQPELMWHDQNYNKTNVYRMDFSNFKTPGHYRVYVEGVGCSYSFEIGAQVWQYAFLTQMKGLYNERSGVELGPPYTAFRKPRDFHPADGVKVYQSTYSVLDGPSESPELEKRSTGQLVPEAWGGYHDAGDWNPRRVTHMRVTMAQLELLEMYPQYFRGLKLSIPPTPNVPDLLTEALFEIDCFRRLQKPDGGMTYGIETNGDPVDGEVSWLQSFPAYVYAPDIWSSYIYAGVAARAAKLLTPTRPDLAKIYQDSALRAMQWAEADYAKRKAAGTLDKLRWEIKDDRNLSALMLYDLTGDKHWHDVFLEDTVLTKPNASIFAWGVHVQRDAVFAYARLSDKMADPAIKKNAVAAIEQQAQAALNYAKGNAFNLTTPDKGKPMFLGFYSTPDAIELARAHYLTGKSEYLAGAVQACQFQSGCNPNNMTYTVGVGRNWPLHPLHLDSRRTGQPAPEGLTVYGNFDFIGWKDQQWALWPITYYLDKGCTPSAWEWPIPEAYFDIFLYPAINEFTVDAWAPNVYVWGYLAAHK